MVIMAPQQQCWCAISTFKSAFTTTFATFSHWYLHASFTDGCLAFVCVASEWSVLYLIQCLLSVCRSDRQQHTYKQTSAFALAEAVVGSFASACQHQRDDIDINIQWLRRIKRRLRICVKRNCIGCIFLSITFFSIKTMNVIPNDISKKRRKSDSKQQNQL